MTLTAKRSVKRSRKSGRANGEDRISNLSESVISNILSRLPTKDAVRTCVLSKDWEFKWTSIYNMDIDDTGVSSGGGNKMATFVNYVERLLLLSQNLRSFRLECGENYDSSRMTAWISAALRRNVESLEVISSVKDGFLCLPRSLLNNTLLKRLKLELPCTFKVPSENHFPNLTSLYLGRVEMRNELSSTDTLIFSFPVLETLELKDCKWLNVKFVEINAPALTEFTSETPDNAQVYDYSIKILGRRLTHIKSYGVLPENLVLTGSSVVCATLYNVDEGWDPYYLEKSGLQVRRLLKRLQSLEKLELSGWIVQAIALSKQGHALPRYDKLQRLTLGSLTNDEAILELLHATSYLKSLVIDLCDLPAHYDYEAVESVPSCIVNQLEKVELIYYNDSPPPVLTEFHLEKFFMKNGLVLKTFHLNVRFPSEFPFGAFRKKEIVDFLSTLPKGSNCLTIIVY